MPTYEYACSSCGRHLEIFQSFSEKALTKCRSCGGKLRKVYSPVGIVFKVEGFYRNDSRVNTGNTLAAKRSDAEEAPAGEKDGQGGDAGSKEAGSKADDGAKDGASATSAGGSEPASASAGGSDPGSSSRAKSAPGRGANRRAKSAATNRRGEKKATRTS
jgi:putative FmdB family regulatory protein